MVNAVGGWQPVYSVKSRGHHLLCLLCCGGMGHGTQVPMNRGSLLFMTRNASTDEPERRSAAIPSLSPLFMTGYATEREYQ
jgi:hypothetical protein